MRLLALIFSLGSIYLFYQLLKKLNFKKFSLNITTLLLATSPLHIYYSHENRMYMLATFGFLASFYTFLNYLEKQSIKNLILLSGSLIIMGFSHYLTLFTIPIFLIYGYKQINKKIISPLIPLIFTYLIYSPILIQQIRNGIQMQQQYPVWQSTVGNFSLKASLLLPLKFTIGRISWQPQTSYLLIGGLLTIIFWTTALLGLKKAVTQNNNKIKLIYTLLFIPPIISLLISPWISVFSYFRFLYLLPFFYLTIGLSKQILNKQIFKFTAITLVIINLVLSSIYLFNPKHHRENWKGMVNWLHQQNDNNAPVIVLGQINKPFIYYDHNQSNNIYVSNPKKLIIGNRIENHDTIYLVSYGLPIFDPNDKIRQKLRENNYTLKQGESFRKVGIEIWTK